MKRTAYWPWLLLLLPISFGLWRLHFDVEVLDVNPLYLCRFSKFCRRLHRGPQFGLDPAGYLERVISLLKEHRFDVLSRHTSRATSLLVFLTAFQS